MTELIDAKTARKLTEENAIKTCVNFGEELQPELIKRLLRHIDRGEMKLIHISKFYVYSLDDIIKKQMEQVKNYFINKEYSFTYEIENYNSYYHQVKIKIEW